MKKATVFDVAREAGVSRSSVSRVLNNVDPVSPRLRDQVEQAVEKVGYHHRRHAGSRTSFIAVLIVDGANPYFTELYEGILEASTRLEMVSSLLDLKGGEEHVERISRWIVKSGCDGIIYCSSSHTLSNEKLASFSDQYRIPVVLINRDFSHPKIPTIRINFEEGMYGATRHLLKLSHRRIACLTGRPGSDSDIGKLKGVERALAEVNLSISPDLFLSGDSTIEWGYQNMNRFLALPEDRRPTAVLAFNDLLALGAMHAMRARRLRTPDDVSIVGFDDVAMSAHSNPPLTTVSPPKRQMGNLAVRLLHQIRTEGSVEMERYTMLESPLIVRESTGYCRQ